MCLFQGCIFRLFSANHPHIHLNQSIFINAQFQPQATKVLLKIKLNQNLRKARISFSYRNKEVWDRVIAWLLCSVTCVKTDLSTETRDERLYMDEYTHKEIKRNNESSNHDDDLTYVTTSPENSSDSKENEHTKVQTSVIGSNQVREIST